MKKILLVCGSGIYTSTAVRKKIEEQLNTRGYKGQYTITQGKVAQVVSQSADFDCIVSTVAIKDECACPVIIATGILTNQDTETIYDKIENVLK